MRYIYSLVLCLSLFSAWAQTRIQSNVYPGKQPGILFHGEATAVKHMTLELIEVKGNKSFKKAIHHKEGVVFIKRGSANIQLGGIKETLTPGSVALITLGEKFKLKNTGDSPAEFYLLSYESKSDAGV